MENFEETIKLLEENLATKENNIIELNKEISHLERVSENFEYELYKANEKVSDLENDISKLEDKLYDYENNVDITNLNILQQDAYDFFHDNFHKINPVKLIKILELLV